MNIRIISGFSRPFAIQQDSKKRFYVANFIENPSVGIFDETFEPVGWLTSKKLSKTLSASKDSLFQGPHSILIDKDGIFVSDYRARKIFKFSIDGEFIENFLSRDGQALDWLLSGPASAQMDSDKNFYISDYGSHSIQKFSSTGEFLGWLGATINGKVTPGWNTQMAPHVSRELGGFDRPHSLVFDGESNLLIADTWNHRVQKFSYDGRFLGWLGMKQDGSLTKGFESRGYSLETSTPGGFSKPVSIDIEDDIFVVSEYGNSRIQKFSVDGEFLGWFGGRSDGEMTAG
ncbi:MAG: repeat containing protein [Bacteriovoracaceae bacterium]|nr:repeat containing protein [Bacteriovoracaceae bacterium]